jgi:peroxiredoxin family protein
MPEKEKCTLVVFSGELDRALSAFIIATTAASMGMQVTMFFTFWGLNIIKKNEGSIKSKGLMHKMLNIMNRGGSRRLKISHFNMMGIGTGMMKQLMKDSHMPSLDELIKTALELGVKLVPCSTTCNVMGISPEGFIDGVESIAGAAYFVGEARESKINLFI